MRPADVRDEGVKPVSEMGGGAYIFGALVWLGKRARATSQLQSANVIRDV